MKKFKARFVSALLSAAMVFGSFGIVSVQAEEAEMLNIGSWYESTYAEWKSTPNKTYKATYREKGTTDVKAVDAELIREISEGKYRLDILGLKGNTEYEITLEATDGSEKCNFSAKPAPFDRSGFAFDGTNNAPGAYNADGTVPDDALIIYVTEENKKNVYNNKNIKSILSGFDSLNGKKPVILRVIGEVTPLSSSDTSPGMWKNTCGVTIEGVGPGSGFVGWGIGSGDNKDTEFRNLSFRDYIEDAIGFEKSTKLWIHNNDFYSGYNPKDSTAERDKLHGDGSCDLRECNNVTVSYNHFKNTDKTSLIGSSSTSRESTGNITFHHNFFDHTGQRTPRVRWHNIHAYNNYYYGTTAYGIGCTCNASIFAENNFFEDASSPFLTSSQGGFASKFSSNDGGVIKAYNNILLNTWESLEGIDYFIAPSREYRLTADDYTTKAGGYTYNNFDASGYIAAKNYLLESPEDARANAFYNAGTLKDTVYPELEDIAAPEAKGNITNVYYYDPETSGSASAFGGKDGTGDFFKGSISLKSNTASGYRGTEKYNYSGSFSSSGNITFTTSSQAKLTMIASSTANSPVRMEVTNSAEPDAVYHGTFQSGNKGNDVLTTIELLKAGTYTIAPKSNVDFYYIEVAEYDGAEIPPTLPDADIPTPPEDILYGDADSNSKIEANDSAMILQYVLNKSALTVDEKFETRCDVDGESGVTANDATNVLQKTLNGSFMMPVEKKYSKRH